MGATRTRKFVWLALALVACLVTIVWTANRPDEPEPLIQGKSVNYWLTHLPPDFNDALLNDPDHPIETAGPEIIPALIRAVERPDRSKLYGFIWRNLPWTLWAKLPQPPPAASVIRTVAAFRLGQFGATASNAVPAITKQIEGSTAWDRSRGIQALGYIGQSARSAIPLLVKLAANTNQFIRQCAITSILEIGITNLSTPPPEIMSATQDPYPWVKGPAAVAVWAIDRKNESRAVLKQFLSSNDRMLITATAKFLGYAAPLPDDLEQMLVALTEHSNETVRCAAAFALVKTRPERLANLLPLIIEAAKNGEMGIPTARLLGDLGPAASNAIPVLQDRTSERGTVLRRAVVEAILKIQRSAPRKPDKE